MFPVDAGGFVCNDHQGKRRQAHVRLEIDDEQVWLCRAFLSKCEPTSICRFSDERLRRIIRRAVGLDISSGAVIWAAQELELVVKRPWPNRPCAKIGVTKRSVEKVFYDLTGKDLRREKNLSHLAGRWQ